MAARGRRPGYRIRYQVGDTDRGECGRKRWLAFRRDIGAQGGSTRTAPGYDAPGQRRSQTGSGRRGRRTGGHWRQKRVWCARENGALLARTTVTGRPIYNAGPGAANDCFAGTGKGIACWSGTHCTGSRRAPAPTSRAAAPGSWSASRYATAD